MTAPITRRPADLAELPLSALQQRIWYLCTAYQGDASPQVFIIWRMRGPLHTQEWLNAVSAVVDRHESFRTTFVMRDGQPVQVINPPNGLETELIDLTDLSEPEREEQALQIVAKRTHALLDLFNGPLVRSCLIRLGDEHHVWCFTAHHLLADGASQRILSTEVRAIYRSFVDGVTAELPELKVQYGDFALWQQTVQQPAEEADLSYWREQLTGVPLLELPTDRPRPAEKSAGAGELFHSASGELAQRIAALARARRCTTFMVLLAADAGAAVLLLRAGGHLCRLGGGRPHGGRPGAGHRPVRQHRGAARRPVRRPDLRGVAGADPHSGDRGATPAERAVQPGRGRAEPASHSQPDPAVPSHLQHAARQRRQGQGGPGRAADRGLPARSRQDAARPGHRRVAAEREGVQDRLPLRRHAVRRQHGGRDGRALRAAAGRRGRPPRRPPVGVVAPIVIEASGG